MMIFKNQLGMFEFALAFIYGRIRFFYFVKIKKYGLKKFRSVSKYTEGVDYSMGSITAYGPDKRLFWPLFLISSIPDLKKNSLLILGPRFETEILLARSMGYEKNGIRALDTFSYSPLIDVGDMHNMPYESNKFDGIICGWTISYSTDPKLAASEMTRVLAKGGYIVLSVHKVERSFKETIPGILPPEVRIQTISQFDELFPSLQRVAGFETDDIKESTHTIVAYKKL